MADQQDEFYLEPEIQEVRNFQPINSITEYPPYQTKPLNQEIERVHLKMVQIPKEQSCTQYRPFRFQREFESQQSEEEQAATFTNSSAVSQYYQNNPCVYQRFDNTQCNQVGNYKYFAGVFAHRKILAEANCKQTHQIIDIFGKNNDNSKMQTDKQGLVFDSRFEGGNLFAAYKVSQFQYDLMMSNDTNSMGGSNQWFYFSVSNMHANKNYTFSIVNFTKSDSLFNYGMAPTVYSLCQNRNIQNLQHGWRRLGKQISYKRGRLPREKSNRKYYCLTFSLFTPHEKDKLFVSHSYPYSHEKLNLFLGDKVHRYSDIVTRFTIGKTVSKRPIDALMICHAINKKRDNRKAIIVMARQHPGETQGSFVCQGLVERLLFKSRQSDILLRNYVFYVIPMVNPDGVIYGHYRCNLLGKDLNRKWDITDKDPNCPQVTSIKTFIQELSRQRQIRFILDLHGHSKKLNSFFYSNPYPEHPEVVRIFPFICSKLHQGIQYFDCTFATEECKRKAARVYLSYFYHLIHVYTFQSSFYAYYQNGNKVEFTPKEYRKLGTTLINSLAMQLQHQIKYQQSFQFAIKSTNKQFMSSLFVKYLNELKNSKTLINTGSIYESGSDSKPQDGELNNEQLQSLRLQKNNLISNLEGQGKSIKVTRKGIRDIRDYNYNTKPLRNIKFLQISKINSVIPDRFQLALQPIKKKQQIRINFSQFQTESKFEVKLLDLKPPQIQSYPLPQPSKRSNGTDRRLSSLIKSINSNKNNIIIKVDEHIHSMPRQNRIAQIHTRPIRNAFSQTMIAINKNEGKGNSSEKLPAMQSSENQRYDLIWPKISQMNINNSIKGDLTKDPEILFNGMVKRFIKQKEIYKRQHREHMANSHFKQKSNSFTQAYSHKK